MQKTHKTSRALAPIFLLLVTAFPACEEPEAGQGAVAFWTVSQEASVAIGEVEGDPPYLFQSIRDARFLKDGRIVIADHGQSSIRVYDPQGRFLTEMGLEGEGPGEFTELRAIWISQPDTIGVWDSGNRRFTTYLADGTLTGSHPVLLPPDAPRGLLDFLLGVFSDGSKGVAWVLAGPRQPGRFSPDRMPFGRFGPEGGFLGMMGEATGLQRINGSPGPFSPYPHALALNDSLFFTDGLLPEITVRGRDGAVARTLSVPARDGDDTQIWDWLRQELATRDDQWGLQRLEGIPRDTPIPHIAEMLADDRQRLWVKRYDPGTDALWLNPGTRLTGGTWWIIEPGGGLVAEVTVPDDVAPLDVQGDLLLGLTTDDLGVERVVVHTITGYGNPQPRETRP